MARNPKIEREMVKALRRFADAVTAKMTQLTTGDPEDQLRAPFETFINAVARALAWNVVSTGETRLPGRMGKPDYAIHMNNLLVGYVELKAPGLGATPSRFTGHNREQWKRFKAIPNLLYCDGNDWGLYRAGKADRPVVRLSGDVATDGRKAVADKDTYALAALLIDFLSWQPFIPTKGKGKIDLKGLADLLAPLCRMLRDDVKDALKDPNSPLVQLARDWRQLLFPDATDSQFADAYAQTVTFALLLARSEGADPLTLIQAENALSAEHSLLSRALQVLTDPNARTEISASLNLLLRVIGIVPPANLIGPDDPWLYFYEDFLAVYDPKLRKDAGVYYTPIEVVRAQVRLIDNLLTNRLGKKLGFADLGVVTLDPAVGTGTYLLGVIEHALSKVQTHQGAGAVPEKASDLARNLYGFENMVGPFAVSELRVSRALVQQGATMPSNGTQVYLTDTLENPHTKPPQLPLILKPIAEQHSRALEVKDKIPVIVCLGNPPYDRHEAAGDDNRARTGGWVRWGDDGKRVSAIFKDFLNPAIAAGHAVDVKNLYNLYVYFWRWALWKVFEHPMASGPGVVSFISAASYLDGHAFCGMREHMRRFCDEIWIIDLGGEGRGARKSENIFTIQTPVAIAVAARYNETNKNDPAKVHYASVDGTREVKLKSLGNIQDFKSLQWEKCPEDWQAPFRPVGKGKYFYWPLLADLFPWQHTGIEFKRIWPICFDTETLKKRWLALLSSNDRTTAFKETRDRKVNCNYPPILMGSQREKPIAQLVRNSPHPPFARYSYRSFDRQLIIADNRLGDYLRPALWRTHSIKQIYITSQFNLPLGKGPALTACCEIPDRHYFSGRGGKDTVPLYRDIAGKEPNILPGLVEMLSKEYGRQMKPEDLLSYVYGILAQPTFTNFYADELESRELRVPITKDAALFKKIRAIGAKLLWQHTYGQRFVPKGKQRGQVPTGKARCEKPVPGNPDGYPEKYEYNDTTKTLHVGDGDFRPVEQDIYEFEVSGLKVVQSWLNYRMKRGWGKKSSPLDNIRPERWTSEFTTELLELLWILEKTLAEYPAQAELLKAVIKKPCFQALELPAVPDKARKPPSHSRGQQQNHELELSE